MDISLEVDDEESLRGLYRWLREDEIRRTTPVTLTPTPPRPGEMGASFEVITAVVSNGIALGGLLVAVASWRGSRPRPPKVRIRHGGTVVELDGNPEEIRRIMDALAPAENPDPDEDQEDNRDQDESEDQHESQDQDPGVSDGADDAENQHREQNLNRRPDPDLDPA